ncbi:MAG: hypothetical protein HFG34_03065 [Eubacterium sp.]|nr:hypothetical protein [Eubacterium sp.]
MEDKELLRDIREGRTDAIESIMVKDEEYRKLIRKQEKIWDELQAMGLPDGTMDKVEEYSSLTSKSSGRYLQMIYEQGFLDGLHIGKM